MSFFAELKRRNVFKVAAAYGIVGWLILQVSDTLVPALHLPEWFHSGVAFVLILGFPLAVIFAWAYEMTPDGLRREKEVDRVHSITPMTGAKLNHTIIFLLVVALGYFAFDKFVLDPRRDAELVHATQSAGDQRAELAKPPSRADQPEQASIAVLPFVNMSDDGANEYFSDGLSEELLNLLAKIPELKVAARTSSFQFKGHTGDIGEIATQLKVANVLEGSVRKSGSQVRITAQLIKADDGYHLWSETYDRTLENIFATQDEIATAVVGALKVRLLGSATPVTRETQPEAYAFYLQGRHWYNQSSKESTARSVDAYRRAIEIDPGYAPAWAGLSMSILHQAGQGWSNLDAGVAEALQAAQHSVTLDEDLALGWVALSQIQGEYLWDWAASAASVRAALKQEPNSSFVLKAAGSRAGSLGQLEQAIAHYRKAVAIDPLNLRALDALVGILDSADRLQEAEAIEQQIIALNPDYYTVHTMLAWLLLRQGQAEQALAEVEQETDGFWGGFVKHLVLYSLGRDAEADALFTDWLAQYQHFGAYQVAMSFAWRNEHDMAFQWLDRAFDQHDPGMGAMLKDPTLRSLHGDPRWEALLDRIGLLEAWAAMPAKWKASTQ